MLKKLFSSLIISSLCISGMPNLLYAQETEAAEQDSSVSTLATEDTRALPNVSKWGTCTVTVDSDNNMRISAGKPVVSDSGELFLKPWNSETRSIVFEPGFDTSEVTSMTLMFFNCFSLEKLDLTHLDTSNVRDMSGMFFGNQVLEQLDVSCLDTSNVTNMRMMFSSCKNLKQLNLSGLDTSKAEDMSWMFSNCESLEELDLSHFDTAQATTMYRMFVACPKLLRLDVSSFDTSNVTDMKQMFDLCKNMRWIKLSSLFFQSTVAIDAMNGILADTKWYKESIPRDDKTWPEMCNSWSSDYDGWWHKEGFYLTFDSNGGSEISSLFTSPGKLVDLSGYVPVRDGYTFVDWYSDRDLKYRVRYIAMDEDATIYAKWEKLPVDYDLLRTAVEMTNGLNEEDFSIFLTAVKALAQIKSELIDVSDDQNEVDSAAKEINTLLLNLRRSPKSDSLSQLW